MNKRLEEFIAIQWRLSREAQVPVMKYFEGLDEKQLFEMSVGPTREFWQTLIQKGMMEQISEWLEKWKTNEMPILSTAQVLAEDITKGHYVRRLSLMHFLPEYTKDFNLYSEISSEIDYYLQILTAATFRIYMDLQAERLREGSRFTESLIDSSQDAIIVLDSELRIAALNRSALTHFSLIREEAIGKAVNVALPYMSKAFESALKKALGGEPVFLEKTVSNASEDFFDVHMVPLVNEENAVYGVLCVAHNVTQFLAKDMRVNDLNFTLREKDEQLRKKQEEYHRMISEVKDYAIILLDVDGTIRNWNMGAERIKGYASQEIIGRNFRLFYQEEDRRAGLPENLIRQAVNQGRAHHEGWRVRKDGTCFWGSVVITALHGEDGTVTGFTKVTRDLTERKKTEEELKEKHLLLEAQNKALKRKNKELSAFNYVASHDLQESIRKIRIFANLILDPVPRHKNKETEYLRLIVTAADSMQHFIEGLTAYSRAYDLPAAFSDVNLEEIMESVRNEVAIQGFNAPDVSIKGDLLPSVWGAPDQLRELFKAIIGNSIKYRKAGIDVRIQITCERTSGSAVKHPKALANMTYSLISISDNGIGFDQEYAEKIFEPFQRLHSKSLYPGAGVGLAICKAIAINHHALIYAEGKRDVGATIFIALPVDIQKES